MKGGVRLIFARHGEATSTMENPERPLTITGRRHVEQAASRLLESGRVPGEIRHSDRQRARQTAKIFGNRLGVPVSLVRSTASLGPHDDPVAAAVELEAEGRSLMVVSHLPFLSRVVSELVARDADRVSFRFTDAGVVVLGRARGAWQVETVFGSDLR